MYLYFVDVSEIKIMFYTKQECARRENKWTFLKIWFLLSKIYLVNITFDEATCARWESIWWTFSPKESNWGERLLGTFRGIFFSGIL